MRTSSLYSIILFLVAAVFAVPATERPNIILIFVDDLGYSDIGCYGATDVKTPNLDQLAAEGTRFTSFYVAQSVCTASRAALMTGCYANRVSMSGALNHTSTTGIHQSEVLLSDLFKKQGYATAMFGKWHLGNHPPFQPQKRGFDEWAGIPYSNDNGPLHPVAPNFPSLPWYVNDAVTELDPDQSQFTKRITDLSLDFIKRNKDKPFFLYVPHIMPHVPIFASEKFKGTSKRGIYGDVIHELDWGVGEIMKAVKELGLDNNTLIMFSSDNGPFISYGEHAGFAAPLREGKLTTFEGGIRVPGIARWPKKVPAGRVSDELFTTLDLYATFARLIGVEVPTVPGGGKRDSLDLSPHLLGQADAKGRDIFWYYAGKELQAVRKGAWKLHVPHKYLTVAAEPGKGGKPSNWGKGNPKSIEESGIYGIASRHGYRVEEIGLALYNLSRDPGETSNVAEKNPDIVAELQQIVAQARADLGDELTKSVGAHVRPAGDVRPPLPPGVKVVTNQTFVVHKTGAVLLDLYLPSEKPATPLPVVMWIHGGGWKSGAKEPCPWVYLAADGYAVASINYRLIHEAQWPAQIDDCRAALGWLRENAEKYTLDPRRIAVGGSSAGGHLAALLGTTHGPSHVSGGEQQARVRAVIDLFGATDLLTIPANVPSPDKTDADLAKSNAARLLGGIIRDIPDKAQLASALHQVSSDDAPFLIIHGSNDTQVPLDQSQRLHEALQKAGVSSTFHIVDGAGHGGKEFDSDEVRNKIRAFLQEKLAP
jgi:arylsulfatase A-like enzyme/pimeloyl-ACP methyl ester carboxylesterase